MTRITNDQLRRAIEQQGYWLTVEGRRYFVFRRHQMVFSGSRQDVIDRFMSFSAQRPRLESMLQRSIDQRHKVLEFHGGHK